MPLTADWKTAKSAFETTTGKKKPTAKFLGVFRKGTGIDASLAKADSAKTAKDLRTALDKFKTDATSYTKTLKAAAADPASVPATDKAAYITAVGVLDSALAKLIGTGELMATTLEKADGKSKVDVKDMQGKAEGENVKREADANEHLDKRKKIIGVLNACLAVYKKNAAELDDCLKNALAQTTQAKKMRDAHNSLQTKVAIGVVERFKEKAAGIMGTVDKDWANRAKQGGELALARGDFPKNNYPTSWGPDRASAYLKESGTLFRAGDGIQSQVQTTLSAMRQTIKDIEAASEEAIGYDNTSQDPQIFVQRLTEMTAEAEKQFFWGDKKAQGMTNTLANQKKGVDTKASPADQMLVQITTGRDGEVKLLPLVAARFQAIGTMVKRANAIPGDARALPEVAAPFKKFTEMAKKANDALTAGRNAMQKYIDWANGAIPTIK